MSVFSYFSYNYFIKFKMNALSSMEIIKRIEEGWYVIGMLNSIFKTIFQQKYTVLNSILIWCQHYNKPLEMNFWRKPAKISSRNG